jgi:hypothetical protein
MSLHQQFQIPSSLTTEEPEWIFPFDYMAVGESFFIPTLRPAQMTYAVDTAAKNSKVRVKIFTCEKEGHLGVRVWKIKG